MRFNSVSIAFNSVNARSNRNSNVIRSRFKFASVSFQLRFKRFVKSFGVRVDYFDAPMLTICNCVSIAFPCISIPFPSLSIGPVSLRVLCVPIAIQN